MDWKSIVVGIRIDKPEVFGAGFRKAGVKIADHPNLITFDGDSVYFFGISKKEAEELLNEVRLLNGKIGWLAYMLQEVFYHEAIAGELYDALFDALYAGALKRPEALTKDALYQWLDNIAPEVEQLIHNLQKINQSGCR